MNIPARSRAATAADERGVRPTLEELCQNARLLVKLRWAAGLSISLCTVFAKGVLDVRLQTAPLLIIGLLVLTYNGLLYGICHTQTATRTRAWRVAWGQIALDWAAMTALVHFTGGITSPALVYFVIHAALSGTVLLPWHARGLSVLAIVIVGGLSLLEGAGWLPHEAIPDLGLDDDLYKNTTYIFATLFFFGTTTITLAEMVANKAQNLRLREDRIRRLYEARSTFVRIATHELRSPLAAGLSLMHSIEQGYAGEINEQQKTILHRVTVRLEGLRALIDDLLDLASSQEASIAQVPLEPVSVRAALQGIIERETPNAEQKDIMLQAKLSDGAGMVLANDSGLSILFGNLVNNAIKYTPDGGQVTVSYALGPDANTAQVTVSDTGIGIPAGDLPKLFSEFFRASNARGSHITGTGIGLAAVRTLVERYHGEITLESEEGKGTTFQVILPLAP